MMVGVLGQKPFGAGGGQEVIVGGDECRLRKARLYKQ